MKSGFTYRMAKEDGMVEVQFASTNLPQGLLDKMYKKKKRKESDMAKLLIQEQAH